MKIKLHGFNNLTKSLAFNIYDICYARSVEEKESYIKYIDSEYNANRLTEILVAMAKKIDAKILNITSQNYDPQGSSVCILVAEDSLKSSMMHLDKSHLTVHTYPESHPDLGICTFRVDIDISTCGIISPLQTLNDLINFFDSDIVMIDYRVRGFTRDVKGLKHFIDHKINSIQNFIGREIVNSYQTFDVNVVQENIYHTKMLKKNFDLEQYMFNGVDDNLTDLEKNDIHNKIYHEMLEIFHGTSM